MQFVKKLTPAQIIALGFAAVIFLGSILLSLPAASNENLTYLDALYTAVSCVCVTGLAVVEAGTAFTFFGQAVMAVLIQIGGLGVACIGVGIILAMGRKVSLKSRRLVRESLNLNSGKGLITFIKDVFLTSIIIEVAGAALSFISLSKRFPLGKAIWVSIYHSIAAFNNAGFDIIGDRASLGYFTDDVLFNLVTAFMIVTGGIGFLVIRDLLRNKFNFHKLTLHSKIVISVSAVLIVAGTVFFMISEQNITLLGAFFTSISARTAGFATYPISGFSNAGLILIMLLMFIGASSGSTGGGIKTGTIYIIFLGIKTAATNRCSRAFHYSISQEAFKKASVIALLGISLILISTWFVALFDPQFSMRDVLFEMVSAFGTVGFSTGITPEISVGSKLVTIIVMYCGRLGPLTFASLWSFGQEDRVRYPEGEIAIG